MADKLSGPRANKTEKKIILVSMLEYFKNLNFIFTFAFAVTLLLSYLEGKIFKIKKPLWAHIKNSVTTGLVSVLCVYLFRMNDSLDIFEGPM